jgi:hypothetical protein
MEKERGERKERSKTEKECSGKKAIEEWIKDSFWGSTLLSFWRHGSSGRMPPSKLEAFLPVLPEKKKKASKYQFISLVVFLHCWGQTSSHLSLHNFQEKDLTFLSETLAQFTFHCSQNMDLVQISTTCTCDSERWALSLLELSYDWSQTVCKFSFTLIG